MELGKYNNLRKLEPFCTDLQNTLLIGRGGKTTTLINYALELIHDGQNIVFVGDEEVDEILLRIPQEQQKRVLYFNPTEHPFAFNLLHNVPLEQHALFANTVLDAVKSVWGYDIATPTLDQYIRGTVLSLLAVPDGSLIGAKFLLTDQEFRDKIKGQLRDYVLEDFWKDFETMTDKEQRQETSSSLNKLRSLLIEPAVSNCLDQKTNKLDFEDTIVLVSLRQAELGEDNARLMGALVLASLYARGLQHLNTTVFIDDADRYGKIVGKVQRALTTYLSVQNLDLFPKSELPAILAGTDQLIALRTSAKDARTLEPEFHLNNSQPSLSQIPDCRAYLAQWDKAIELHMKPIDYPLTHQANKIMKRCASQCSQPIDAIVKRFRRFFK